MLVGAPQIVLEQLRQLPGGETLLELAAGREDVELVGGAVRDLLLGHTPRELDVVVADDAIGFAGELARRVGSLAGENPDERFESTFHERFRTALVWWDGGRIDIATRRAESYPAPGALPDVRVGTPAEDLERRDFTVNALAVALGGQRRGELREAPHGLEDLRHRRLRVLHEASFLDDPTRLLRLARYAARLGFAPEEHTATLARQALAAGALRTVSGARIGGELRLALSEPDAPAALAALSELGVLVALHPSLRFEEPLARDALSFLPADGRPDLLLLASLLLPMTEYPARAEAAMVELLDGLEFVAGDRRRVIKAVLATPALPGRLIGATSPSALRATALDVPVEAVGLAAALSDPTSSARHASRRWLQELRDVRLSITGDDLLAAGVPAGPEIGLRLEAALNRKLDEQLADGREAELRAALEAMVET
jgi:tRNA nucleotidyltransferase (CCA-adding enzyme)